MTSGIGIRLKMARSLANLSQRDVAAQMNLSPMMISKYENEQLLPNSDALIRLARILAQPIEFFLRGPAIPTITPLHHLKSIGRGKDEEALIAKTQSWLERYLAVESLYPPDEFTRFAFPAGFPYPIANIAQVEEAADELRRAWGLADLAIDNLTGLLEDKGIKVDVIDGDSPCDAWLFQLDNDMPVMLVAPGTSGDQQRSALAYELAYLMLNIAPEINKESNEELNNEKALLCFARAFLVPQATVYRELGRQRHALDIRELHLLSYKYGVSMQTWIERAHDLNVLSEAKSKQLLHHPGLHHLEAAESLPSEEPQRLTRLVLRALAEDIISQSRAAELLGVPSALECETDGKTQRPARRRRAAEAVFVFLCALCG